METIGVDGTSIEYQWIPPTEINRPALVLLHEGLGCAAMWRDWPERIARQTGCGVLNYSRPGYGGSSGSLRGRTADYLEPEAGRILPGVMDALGLDDVILFGHSDGATIALLYGAAPTVNIRGLILEAPHVFVEDVTLAGIREAGAAFRTTDIRRRLERYHGDRVDEVFRSWHDVWLSEAFRGWNIEHRLDSIAVPVLLIQGEDDEYGTGAQLESIACRAAGPVDTHLLARCGHSPHRDQPERVLTLVRDFVNTVTARGPG